MREEVVENHLKKQAERHLDALVYKFTAPGRRSVPDRLMLWSAEDGSPRQCFVELKAPGKKPSVKQIREIRRIAAKGQWVTWLDTKDLADELIELLALDQKPGTRL